MKKLLVLTLAAVLSLGIATSASAVVLAPGDSAGTTGAVSPGAGDPILDSIIGGTFTTTTGVVTGTYDAWVRQDADGFLVFEFKVHNDQSSADGVHRFTVITFSGFATDVDAEVAGRGIDRSVSGGTVGWDFSTNGVLPGQSSALMWVKTDATNWTGGWVNFINGGVDTQPGFMPDAAVPEPTSMLLFGTGLLGFAGRLRKRFNA